jgi:hypothetical protein
MDRSVSAKKKVKWEWENNLECHDDHESSLAGTSTSTWNVKHNLVYEHTLSIEGVKLNKTNRPVAGNDITGQPDRYFCFTYRPIDTSLYYIYT